MKLVKFTCGCVGFEPDQNGRAIIVDACDRDYGDRLGMSAKDMSGKQFVTLSEQETEKYLSDLSSLISDGYRFRTIKSLLS